MFIRLTLKEEDIIGSTVKMFGRPWRIVGWCRRTLKSLTLGDVKWYMDAMEFGGRSKELEITHSSRQGLGLLKPG